ncbi:MAG: class I SAM-dependent DNA methyltransferase [Synergistaceae bacterium]|nr:class I SAM-dependent DNA methyltransferase [Synergistaceae bacterium]
MDINERSYTQTFWLTFIRDTFGIISPEDYVDFEKRVDIEHAKFIDAYIPSTGTIIEQKSPGKDLEAAFLQAKNYYDWLPFSQRGRYIITCDFDTLHIHDMENPTLPPQIMAVKDATKDNLPFLLTPGETAPIEVAVSVKAGELVKSLYGSLLDSLAIVAKEQHYDKDTYDKARENINIFCVRLVFLLYAEDSGLFAKSQFHDYLKPRSIMAKDALANLFAVLNTEIHDRAPFLEPELKAFPYVNGGLFAQTVDFPQLSPDELGIIIHDMAEGFNWSGISPVIFGAIFEATINDETRRKEGIHYTSPANIHKVIDPLFLDGLNETLAAILSEPQSDARTQKLLAFQDKLAALRFLDPACGSGNFLTESFICLRRMENRVLAAIPECERPPVKVSITQFHGIESHDFAVNIAKTALWISDHQMWKETRDVVRSQKPPLPLTEYDGIEEEDALRADLLVKGWKIPHDDMLYIMGNPPFIGYSDIKGARKEVFRNMFENWKVDYVAGWFRVASEYVQDKNTKAAFVATNSVVQGEQVSGIFGQLHKDWEIKIDFAHQPFVWKNELPDKKKMAHVHVVIVCISTNPPAQRRLYAPDGTYRLVDNINFYLQEGPDEDIAVPSKTPICRNVPEIDLGNLPRDGGHLIIEAGDYADFIRREPGAERFIRRYVGAYEFINNIPRWCLWLGGAKPDEIRNMPLVNKRVKAVKAFREASSRAATQKLAKYPWLFAEIRQPASEYIVIPRVSSEERRYVPIGFMTPDVIASDAVSIIPGATLYDFGVLTSRVHMAWMRHVCGRLKSDYRYSGDMVYNTFPWPEAGVKERARIEGTARGILDARAESPGVSFAGLYDDTVMPVELRRAHERNDAEVLRAYGWDEDMSEEDVVRGLFGMYHRLTGK